MNKLFFLVISVFMVKTIYSQDVIVKRDSTVIKAKVMEVDGGVIKYKKANYPDGPVFQIKKRHIIRIVYANGDTAVYKKPHTPLVLTDRKGMYLGADFAPAMCFDLKSNSEPAFVNNLRINMKWYFNNHWGFGTGVTYQYSDFESFGDGEEHNHNYDYYQVTTEPVNIRFSSLGIPLHFLYTSGKRLGINVETGFSYYYPMISGAKLSSNYIFTTEAIIGASFRITSKLSVDAGLLVQYDLMNYTGQKNNNCLTSGMQIGLNYKMK
jgi:hypothetical protein